jgi:hypothetical protein
MHRAATLFLCLCPLILEAQQPTQPPTPPPAAAEEQYDTSDGQISLRLLYWYNPTNPVMKTGKGSAANVDSDVSFKGTSKPTPGVELSFPAGRNNSIRLSYFRTQGRGNTTAETPPSTQGNLVWGASFNPGDLLSTSYTVQNAKISLDYLSWPFPLNNARFRVKTLWEVQYTTIKSSVDAPFAATTDSSGNAIQTSGSGSRWFLFPSLGMGIEAMLSKHLRFEMKGSGFALPHRANIWDTEAFFAYRTGSFEIDFGGKAFHFRTSPNRPEYLYATMPGAYVGIRWFPK